ncbi:MAG: hypothetical protein JWM99_4195 [Verrucomicrobiales bacterium]|nr:hypothetical protein [Verrucomicrobiales bacterium]
MAVRRSGIPKFRQSDLARSSEDCDSSHGKIGASEGIRTLEDVERPKRSGRETSLALARFTTFHVVMVPRN